MSKSATAAGVLLAAGAGTRYGMPKVLADGGRWLRACVTALADGGCDDVVVVLGAAVVDVPAPARAVVAQDWEQGLSASVRAGVNGHRRLLCRCCMRWTRPTSAPTRCDECSMRRARRRRGWPAPATVTGPDIPSSSRAGTGRICSTGFAATRARGHSLVGRTDVVAVDCADLASGQDIDTVTTVIPSAAAAKRRTDCAAIAAASAWPSRARVCTVAVTGSSVTSASSSPVVGSQTAQV